MHAWTRIPVAALMTVACTTQPQASSVKAGGNNNALVMPAADVAALRSALPRVEDLALAAMLASPTTLFYDKKSVVPGYQDSMGDPEGMRPNTVNPELIDTAVPGGHARLFQKPGVFHFPFGSGGLDDSTNASNAFFLALPAADGNTLPVAYWRMSHSRWRWLFPVGTVIGEILFVHLPDGGRLVFEIRTRERRLDAWHSEIHRPFPTADSLAKAIAAIRPDWQTEPRLKALMDHLADTDTLEPKTLEAKRFAGAFAAHTGYQDRLPAFGDPALVRRLLTEATFQNVQGTVWKRSGDRISHAPTTGDSYGITANQYDGGLFPVEDGFCSRCHVDAGRQIGDFHNDLVAYGELWGEDQTFSWHPFETSAFVDATGRVVSWNDDNRRIRAKFVEAGIVAPYNAAVHPAQRYRQLPQSWTYSPF